MVGVTGLSLYLRSRSRFVPGNPPSRGVVYTASSPLAVALRQSSPGRNRGRVVARQRFAGAWNPHQPGCRLPAPKCASSAHGTRPHAAGPPWRHRQRSALGPYSQVPGPRSEMPEAPSEGQCECPQVNSHVDDERECVARLLVT
jgi:hypothetical protein